MMNILALTAIFSGIGMVVIFARRLSFARTMDRDEFLKRLDSSGPIFSDFHNFIITPLGKFWRARIIPVFYKKRESFILKFRKIVVKLGKTLLKFDDYLHGKSRIKAGNGGGSKYWNDINEFKNGLNGGDSEQTKVK